MKQEEFNKRIDELGNEFRSIQQRKSTLLADVIAYAQSLGVNEMEFDWEENEAPCCTYSANDDLMDCYITKLVFDGEFPLVCTKVTLHAYYVGEDYDVNIDDINDYDKLELAQYILDNL